MAKRTLKFIPGLLLNRNFFFDVVKPLMEKNFPGLKYAAGLMANGSDVLGYDDETSMDHNWGPRMRMILNKNDFNKFSKEIDKMLRMNLPKTYLDYPTNFEPGEEEYLKQQMKYKEKGPINHLIRLYSMENFFGYFIGLNPKKKLTPADWLVTPQQALLEVSSGEVYYDQVGLEDYRRKFGYYPEDVWLFILQVQWGRLGDLLGFPSRAALAGDEFGSRIIATHVVNELIAMLFILEKKYMPYLKWRGRALADLQNGPELIRITEEILNSKDWGKRQDAINHAHLLLARVHNDLNITERLPLRTGKFNRRPFDVADIGPFYKVTNGKVGIKKLKDMTEPLGAIDQFVNHAHLNHLNYVYRDFRHLVVR